MDLPFRGFYVGFMAFSRGMIPPGPLIIPVWFEFSGSYNKEQNLNFLLDKEVTAETQTGKTQPAAAERCNFFPPKAKKA